MTNVFSATNYRQLLGARLRDSEGGRGGISALAEAIPCQRSHLSRVLKGELHLTPDQALAAARALRFSEAETEYFLVLVDHERAGSKALRTRLAGKLKFLKQEHENIGRRIERLIVPASAREMEYFSSWIWVALHVLTSVPQLRTTKALAQRLQLGEALTQRYLERLAELGFVRRERQQWIFASGSLHTPAGSPVTSFHHGNWRQQAVLNVQRSDEEAVHFTNVQSISNRDVERLRQVVFRAIDEFRKIAEPSEPEDAFCLNFDFFRI